MYYSISNKHAWSLIGNDWQILRGLKDCQPEPGASGSAWIQKRKWASRIAVLNLGHSGIDATGYLHGHGWFCMLYQAHIVLKRACYHLIFWIWCLLTQLEFQYFTKIMLTCPLGESYWNLLRDGSLAILKDSLLHLKAALLFLLAYYLGVPIITVSFDER